MSEPTDALNDALTDDQIADVIAQHDDPDHPDAWTVTDVRLVLERIAESVSKVWGTWCQNIEAGDTTVVTEGDDLIVLDTGQYNLLSEELDQQAEYHGLEDTEGIMQSILTQLMHELADRHCDRTWSVSWPMVVPKPEDGDDRQEYVNATVNHLIKRGLSPGQAWAYYGVKIRGESRNAWAARCGYSDHSVVSEAVRKAEQKIP